MTSRIIILLLFFQSLMLQLDAYSDSSDSKDVIVIGGLTEAQSDDFSRRLKESDQWIGPIMDHIKKAEYFVRSGEFEKAEVAYNDAIKVSGNSIGRRLAREGLCDLYEETGQYQKAINILEKIRDEDTGDSAKPQIDARIKALQEKIK